ncbi:MAG: type 1 periplasmic binding fold superfamily protein, partial [Cytophagia bacterium]|nr:type 1 periplasmic binding fold superfamily protein [Cytophagia bacterium]
KDHQVFFEVASGLNFSYSYGDEDGDGNPIGIVGSATTGDASTGSLAVVLIHEPNKSATGVSSGDPTNAGGEEDVRVSFTVSIQ